MCFGTTGTVSSDYQPVTAGPNAGANPQPSAQQQSANNAAARAGDYPASGGFNPQNYFDYEAQRTGESSQANINQQTQANRPTQFNPFGFTGWSQDANGNWTQASGLSGPLSQAAGNTQQQAAANSAQPLMTGDAARNQAITASYNQATSRLNPQWAQQDQQLSSQLANQGLDPNSQAYRNAMLQQSQAKNDAYSSAMNNAIGQGTAAQQATFNENLQAQQLPYQQLAAMRALEQPFSFSTAGAAAPIDYLGAGSLQSGQGLAQQQQQDANTSQAIQGGTALAGSIAMLAALS